MAAMSDARSVDPRTVMVRIRAAMPGLRPSERRIAAFLLAQPQEVANLSVAELAEKVGTSTTSVLRCTQQIGATPGSATCGSISLARRRGRISPPPTGSRCRATSTVTTRSPTSSPRWR
jgi:hypothetical protein